MLLYHPQTLPLSPQKVFFVLPTHPFPLPLPPTSVQTEIERVLKKVEEGSELFDDLYDKVIDPNTGNTSKYEGELKKEIKKLQRLRDQIKGWLGGAEVRDKDGLTAARKLIESKVSF